MSGSTVTLLNVYRFLSNHGMIKIYQGLPFVNLSTTRIHSSIKFTHAPMHKQHINGLAISRTYRQVTLVSKHAPTFTILLLPLAGVAVRLRMSGRSVSLVLA